MAANAHQDDGREGPAEVNTHRQHNNILRTLPKVRPSVPIKLDHVFFPSFLLSQKEHYQETQENNLFLALNELYTLHPLSSISYLLALYWNALVCIISGISLIQE